jgi:hypothetical protein
VPEKGRKARRLILRVAESTLNVTLKHDAKIVGYPTRSPCLPQLRFKASEVTVSAQVIFLTSSLDHVAAAAFQDVSPHEQRQMEEVLKRIGRRAEELEEQEGHH